MSGTQTTTVPHLGTSEVGSRFPRPYDASLPTLVEITLDEDTPWAGRPQREVPLPRETVLTAMLRGDRVITPSPDEPLEVGDELLFITHAEVEEQLQQVLSPTGA